MSHEIESFGYAEVAGWHGLGVKVSEVGKRDFNVFMQEAGMDWKVDTEPLFTFADERVKHRAVRRISDGSILGVVGPAFTPLQNVDAFKWFQPFLDAGEATLASAGSLRLGSRIFVSAELTRKPLKIGDSEVKKFLLLSHSHDGSLAVRLGYTPVYVVCNNTLSMAHSDKDSKLIRIRHSKRVLENMEDIRETVNTIDAAFEATGEQYRKLVSTTINQNDVLKYVKLVFDIPLEGKLHGKTQNILDAVMTDIKTGVGQDLNVGTAWNAYNGVNYYLNHTRGRSVENRVDALYYGDGAVKNQKALDLALEMVS